MIVGRADEWDFQVNALKEGEADEAGVAMIDSEKTTNRLLARAAQIAARYVGHRQNVVR